MTTTAMQIISTSEMQVGDIVSLDRNGMPLEWDAMIVKNIKDGFVRFFRPYGHSSDVLTTSGVTCYVGVEEFEVGQTDEKRYLLHRRTSLR